MSSTVVVVITAGHTFKRLLQYSEYFEDVEFYIFNKMGRPTPSSCGRPYLDETLPKRWNGLTGSQEYLPLLPEPTQGAD